MQLQEEDDPRRATADGGAHARFAVVAYRLVSVTHTMRLRRLAASALALLALAHVLWQPWQPQQGDHDDATHAFVLGQRW